MNYWKYNLINLRWFGVFVSAVLLFVAYWAIWPDETSGQAIRIALIVLGVLFAGISIGNYVAWRKYRGK